jgi:KaiC/GvpD/RAD55 family RecA-like ATPase
MAKKPSRKKPVCETISDGIIRVPSGIPGLDELIEGGIVKDSSVLVRGDTGAAKTIFSLQYLHHGAKNLDIPGVYISFAESKEATFNHGLKFGWDFCDLQKKGMFDVIRYDPHEVVKIMEEGGGLIRDTVEAIGAKRMVIDSLTAYEMFFENRYKANQSVLSLFEMLKKWDVTSIVTAELPVTLTHESRDRLGFLTEGIINLYHVRRRMSRVRAMEIIKMRDTAHDEGVNLFTITKAGLKVVRGLKDIERL